MQRERCVRAFEVCDRKDIEEKRKDAGPGVQGGEGVDSAL